MAASDILGITFDTVNGLPVHPLIVHVVVVLLPLSALGAIAIAIVPRWSQQYGLLVWIGALVSTGAAWVAEESGMSLARITGVPPAHMQYGQNVKYFAAALFVSVLVLWILDRRGSPRRWIEKVVAVIVVVAAVAAIWMTFLAGDTGAQAVWGSVGG